MKKVLMLSVALLSSINSFGVDKLFVKMAFMAGCMLVEDTVLGRFRQGEKDLLELFLTSISAGALSGLLDAEIDHKFKNVSVGIAALSTGIHIAYLLRREVPKAKVSYVFERKEGLREVDHDDRCFACLNSFDELKNNGGKTVLQLQCCGAIVCEDEMINCMDYWNKQPRQAGEIFKCSLCRGIPSVLVL